MQQDNHIINKLQQLENQQLPDLSQMDSHWQQMQGMLVPAAAPTQQKHWRWAIPAAVLLISTAILLYRNSSSRPSVAANTTPAPRSASLSPRSVSPLTLTDTFVPGTWAIHGDTLKLMQQPPMGFAGNKGRSAVGNGNSDNLMAPSTPDTQYFNINYIPCKDSSQNKASNLRQQWFRELFTQLQKEPNQFVIDNRRDTLLYCQEGTALQIPAGSLGGNANVLFSVKEIYKKSDMVLNQLSATSNKALLESGGMLQLTATVNDQPVDIAPNKPITVYMADTSNMQNMQLFTGEKTTEGLPTAVVRFNEKMEDVTSGASSTYMNWIPQYRYFTTATPAPEEVRVLNLEDNYIELRERRKGLIAIYLRSKESKFSKRELEQRLKEKYGDQYYKIKVKNHRPIGSYNVTTTDAPPSIGDSIWVKKEMADKRKLPYTETRKPMLRTIQRTYDTLATDNLNTGLMAVNNRYGINISRLGWINCDRFYNSDEEKADYVVQLGDSAANYYTLLVFDKINSVMNSYASGHTAIFTGVPVGMKVTVVSVGVNNKGQAVYALQKGVTDKAGLSGITFQPTEAAALPNALSKLDQ